MSYQQFRTLLGRLTFGNNPQLTNHHACTKLRQAIQATYVKFIIEESNKETETKLYWTVKNMHSYKSENYRNMKSIHHGKAVTRLRLSSHNLPVKTGRYRNIPRSHRICLLCHIGDKLLSLESTNYTVTQARNKLLQDVHTIPPQLLRHQLLPYIMTLFMCGLVVVICLIL